MRANSCQWSVVSGQCLGERAIAVRAGGAVVAVNLAGGEVPDAVHCHDNLALPVVIFLDDARREEGLKERGKERAQSFRLHQVQRGAHLGIAGNIFDVIDSEQVTAFLPGLFAE